jgi:hypothetical protein
MDYTLTETAAQVTRAVVPLVIILDILTNTLNIIILRRPNLKRHACTLYFLTLSITDLCYSICITYGLLSDGYNIDFARYSRVFCKLINYFIVFCSLLSVYMLVLASIDRYCSSSLNVQRRRLSNIHTARKAILVVLITTSIFMLGNLVIFDVSSDGVTGCTTNSNNLFTQIFLIIVLTLYVIISPFLMILFGFLTIHNTKKLGRNHLVVFRYRRSERQLARMLIVQVFIHIILSLPFLVLFFMSILPISLRSTIIFNFLFVIFKIPIILTFITPFFLYILSAKMYRDEFFTILKKVFRIRRNIAIHPMANQPTRFVIHR